MLVNDLKKVIAATCKRYPKIPDNVVSSIINTYIEESTKYLMENGYTQFTPDIRADVVPITKRRYILRGVEYESQRMYKIKATLGEKLYNRISKEYSQFREVL